MKFISYTTLTVLTVNLLATSGDITMTWTSPMFSKLYSNDSSINPLSRPITTEEDAFIASLINIGAILGGIPFSYISGRFGRKIGLLGVGIFHIIAYITMAFADNVYYFYFGRVFGGLAVGGGYTLLPMYIAEIAEEQNRGFFSSTLTIFWAFGNFLPYLVGPFLSVNIFNFFNACFPVAFFVLFLLIGTETPFYLVGADRIEDAENVLMLLRSKDKLGVHGELKHIRGTLEKEEGSASLKNIIVNKGLRKAFIISLLIIAFQQLSGWNAITFYLQPIFEASGSVLPSHLSSLIVGVAIFGFSLPAPYLADKFGRKTLIIFSCSVMGVCLIMLGAFFFLENRTSFNIELVSWVPITSLLILTFAFQIGMSGLPWTISSELFPKNVKNMAASASSASCWITSFFMTQFFNDMNECFGKDGTFFMFAGFAFSCVLFTIFYIPETRAKTFTEIQQLLQE